MNLKCFFLGHKLEIGFESGECDVCGAKLVRCDTQTNDAIKNYNKAIELVKKSGILDLPEDSVRILKKIDKDLIVHKGLCRADGFYDAVQVLDYFEKMFKNFVRQCSSSSPLLSKGRKAVNAIDEAIKDVTQLITDKQLLNMLNK